MNWKLKAALRNTILAAPGGAQLYRYLTYRVLGTQHGMAGKWFRVIPNHVRVLQEKFGDDARHASLWCYDSGATPAAAFAAALVSDEPCLLTDKHNRLADTYLETSRKVLAEKGEELAQLARAPEGRFGEVRSTLASCKSSLEAIRSLGMTYSKDHNTACSPEWKGRVGLIFSAGTLEHYTPEQVDVELARMHQALRPGGVLSHVIDHRDHRWHADKSISPLLHLTLSPEEYTRKFGNALDYHNRWMQSDWVRAMERHGFAVEPRFRHAYSDDLVPLDRSKLSEEFRNLPDSDFEVIVTHFVAVKK
jgi:SAM-dependent methyltransferase